MTKIDPRDIKDILDGIHELKPTEREYVHGMLVPSGTYGGVSELELKRVLRELKKNTNDKINPYKLGKIQKKFEEHLNPEPEETDSDEDQEKPRHTTFF